MIQNPFKFAFHFGNYRIIWHRTMFRVFFQIVQFLETRQQTRCDDLSGVSVHKHREVVKKRCVFQLLEIARCSEMSIHTYMKKCDKIATMLHRERPTKPMNHRTVNWQKKKTSDKTINRYSITFCHITNGLATVLLAASVPIQWNGCTIILRAFLNQG